jgi:hypothetical protein
MCDCYFDNPPTLYEQRTVKGRKPHKCCECLRVIERGERHEYVKGLWDGEFSEYRTCDKCVDMRSAAKVECYAFTQLMDCVDTRDGLECVQEFFDRRRENYDRIQVQRRQLANT